MTWLIGAAGALLAVFVLTVLRGAPYVPSKKADLKLAFDQLYILNSSDRLVDIGSGDGVVLRLAAKKGARAVGFEINPILVAISSWLSRNDDHVSVRLADFWFQNLPDDTTIVYTFGESRDITKMYQKVQREANRIGRPIWFMSYGFKVPNVDITRQAGAHNLYQISPLQGGQA